MNRAISLCLGALALCAAALSACSDSPDEPATPTHDSAAEQIARGRFSREGGRLRGPVTRSPAARHLQAA
jgi:hypothetical protein